MSKTNFLKFCFWCGAVIDALAVVSMVFPRVGALIFGLCDFNPGVEYKFAMYIGASLMLGWTVLLIWASRRPQERIFIMPLTLFPVLSGIIAAEIFAVAGGFITIAKMIPLWFIQSVLFVLFICAYVFNRKEGKYERER